MISIKNTAGFTLIEALVALLILTVALVPALVLSTSSNTLASSIRNNLIAANLAQEGAEIIRNIRDTNRIKGLTFNSGLSDGDYQVEWDSTSAIAYSDVPLKIKNGVYGYDPAGTDTIFKRKVTITNDPGCGCHFQVLSVVSWTERGRSRLVQVESHLFDWQ